MCGCVYACNKQQHFDSVVLHSIYFNYNSLKISDGLDYIIPSSNMLFLNYQICFFIKSLKDYKLYYFTANFNNILTSDMCVCVCVGGNFGPLHTCKSACFGLGDAKK